VEAFLAALHQTKSVARAALLHSVVAEGREVKSRTGEAAARRV
jgi:hypothetical protein